MTALSRLRDAERALATDPAHDSAARHAIRHARERAGVPLPPYWLVVPGGRDGRGRLHLVLAAAWCFVGRAGEPAPAPAACHAGAYEWQMPTTGHRWADLSPGSPDRARLCKRCVAPLANRTGARCSGDPLYDTDGSRLDSVEDEWRWQLAWAAASGLPYPCDGAGAEDVPALLAEAERELAQAGRLVVLPGSGTLPGLAEAVAESVRRMPIDPDRVWTVTWDGPQGTA